jgi:hypothetical protein
MKLVAGLFGVIYFSFIIPFAYIPIQGSTSRIALILPLSLSFLSLWVACRAFLTVLFATHFDAAQIERMIAEHTRGDPPREGGAS